MTEQRVRIVAICPDDHLGRDADIVVALDIQGRVLDEPVTGKILYSDRPYPCTIAPDGQVDWGAGHNGTESQIALAGVLAVRGQMFQHTERPPGKPRFVWSNVSHRVERLPEAGAPRCVRISWSRLDAQGRILDRLVNDGMLDMGIFRFGREPATGSELPTLLWSKSHRIFPRHICSLDYASYVTKRKENLPMKGIITGFLATSFVITAHAAEPVLKVEFTGFVTGNTLTCERQHLSCPVSNHFGAP